MEQLHIKNISHIVTRRTKPDWTLRDMRHSDLCVLVCCFEGMAEYHFSDLSFRVRAGDVFFISNQTERSARTNWKKPWVYCSAVFSLHEGIGASGADLTRALGRKPINASKEVMAAFSDLALLWAGRTAEYRLRCAGMILDLVGRLLEEATENELGSRLPNYAKIKVAMKRIESNNTQGLSVAAIAAEIGLSESRFRHLFREATGVSPTRYSNLKKIERAKDLFLSGGYNINEAAEELGFGSAFYFSRVFKSITGQAPSTFLKK